MHSQQGTDNFVLSIAMMLSVVPNFAVLLGVLVYSYMGELTVWIAFPTMYFIGRVTLFFANNYLTEYRITIKF